MKEDVTAASTSASMYRLSLIVQCRDNGSDARTPAHSWAGIAIDRFDGTIVGQQLEEVTEQLVAAVYDRLSI